MTKNKMALPEIVSRDEWLFHNYSTYARGLDQFLNTYNFLDITGGGFSYSNRCKKFGSFTR